MSVCPYTRVDIDVGDQSGSSSLTTKEVWWDINLTVECYSCFSPPVSGPIWDGTCFSRSRDRGERQDEGEVSVKMVSTGRGRDEMGSLPFRPPQTSLVSCMSV